MIQERPNITQTLDSLKLAMNAEEDQILEEDYDEHLNVSLETSVSDEAVVSAVPEIAEQEEYLEADAVFSSEEDVLKSAPQPTPPTKIFVLSRMIQEDGTVLNLDVEDSRPNVSISEDKIETIVREAAKPLIIEWLNKHMHSIARG